MRFFGGTPSPAPLVAANSAIDIWKEIGFEQVHKHIQKQLNMLVENIDPKLLMSPINKEDRGATLAIGAVNRAALRKTLEENDIFFDEREEGFRFSIHGYTSVRDVMTLLDVIKGGI